MFILSTLGVSAAILTLSIGCMGSIGGRNKGPTKNLLSGATNENAENDPPAEPISLDALKVGADRINPQDIWYFDRADLTEKAGDLPPPEFRSYVEQQAARLIRDRTTEMLLYQKAATRLTPQVEKGLQEYIDADIRRIVTEDFGGVQRRYEKHLETQGIALDKLREKMGRDLLVASYLDAEIKPTIVEPSRAELVTAYEAYRQQNNQPQRRRMSLIDVRIMDRLPDLVVEPTREQWDQAKRSARERIESAGKELAGGAAFKKVAAKLSDGLHAVDGGSWGWIRKGSVRERFEPAVTALFQLEAGQVSHVIETPDSFFLVRCDEIDGGETPDFMAVQPELKDNYYRNVFNSLVVDLVDELRRNAHLDSRDLERFYAAVVEAGFALARSAHDGPPLR